MRTSFASRFNLPPVDGTWASTGCIASDWNAGSGVIGEAGDRSGPQLAGLEST